jgi:hypothetical protein
MTNRFTTLAAAAALFTGFLVFAGFSGPARAEMKPLQTIAHWKVTADDTLCDASGEFRDGTLLEFSINMNRVLVISVVNEKWSIPKGSYEVVMQVDRAEPHTVEADASGSHVIWPIALSEANLNLLSYGRTLNVQIGKALVSYDLAHTEAVLKALVRCAIPRLQAANPFSGAAPKASAPDANPFVETPSNPFRRM